MRCSSYREYFSAFLDRVLPDREHWALELHLRECGDCARELRQLTSWTGTLTQLPSPAMPAHLMFQIRNRIAYEQGQKSRPPLLWRWANQVSAVLLPVAFGIASAVLFFATLVPVFATRPLAASPDVPLTITTPPRFRGSPLPEMDGDTNHVVVALLVDQRGRVADVHILAGSPTPQDLRNLRNRLLFAVFDPAMSFGRPRPEQIVISMQTLRVKG